MWNGPGGIAEGEKLGASETAHVVRRTLERLQGQRRLLIGAGIATLLWTGTNLAGPALVRDGIDHGITPGRGGTLNRDVVLYVFVALLAYVTQRVQIMAVARLGEGFLRDLRIRIFDHLLKLSMPFYDREKAGVIISRMTSDIDSLQELVQQGLQQFLSNGLLFLGSVVLLTALSWKLALVLFAVLPFVIFSSAKFKRDSNRAYLDVRDRVGTTLSSLQEGISGVRVVQAFGREPVQIERFAATNQELFASHMRSTLIQSWYVPTIEFAQHVTTTGVFVYGAYLFTGKSVSAGTIVAFVLLLSNLFEPMQQLSQLLNTLQQAAAALNKLYNLLDTPIDVPRPRTRSTCRRSVRSRWWVCPSPTPAASPCCATSTSRSRRARSWPSSARPGPASRPSPSWRPASTTRPRAG